MKLIIEEHQQDQETEIIIRCSHVDQKIEGLLDLIRTYTMTLQGEKDGCTYKLNLDEIQYIESVDDHTFLYGKSEVYESTLKLYELEQKLMHTSCVRISKSCIVNTDCLAYVKPLFDGKLLATTHSGESITINRHYVKAFKEVFGL